MTKCLIDADVISYQCSAVGQHTDQDTGELMIHDFDSVAQYADDLIFHIEEMCMATEPSTLYFTSDERLINVYNRFHSYGDNVPLAHAPNYRIARAVTKPYKGNRVVEKPYHFHNLRAYLISKYDCRIACGIEADDLLAIDLTKNPDAICCSRDKDLKQVPGMHFTWACHNQEQWGPEMVDELGRLWKDDKGKLRGVGAKFFWAQMITGDPVDNIPGVPKAGDAKAYELLANVETEKDCRAVVINLYKEKGLSREYFQEQKALLWIMREEDNGKT